MTDSAANQGQPKPARKINDWDAIGVHYRAGIRSLKDIGAQFEVSDAAIIKHARKVGWTRDLKGKIQAKADAKVSAAMVSAEVSAQTKVTEQITVEVEATVQSRIRLGHRADIQRARALTMGLLAELEKQSSAPELFADIERILAGRVEGQELPPADKAKLSDGLAKALALGSRTGTLKSLTEALRVTIALEREAYGLNDANLDPEDPFTAMLRRVQTQAKTFGVVAADPDHAA